MKLYLLHCTPQCPKITVTGSGSDCDLAVLQVYCVALTLLKDASEHVAPFEVRELQQFLAGRTSIAELSRTSRKNGASCRI